MHTFGPGGPLGPGAPMSPGKPYKTWRKTHKEYMMSFTLHSPYTVINGCPASVITAPPTCHQTTSTCYKLGSARAGFTFITSVFLYFWEILHYWVFSWSEFCVSWLLLVSMDSERSSWWLKQKDVTHPKPIQSTVQHWFISIFKPLSPFTRE